MFSFSSLGGERSSTSSTFNVDAIKSQLPMFAEEPACAKNCPNLSFKQV
jgi:hypothetical protein